MFYRASPLPLHPLEQLVVTRLHVGKIPLSARRRGRFHVWIFAGNIHQVTCNQPDQYQFRVPEKGRKGRGDAQAARERHCEAVVSVVESCQSGVCRIVLYILLMRRRRHHSC